MYVNDMYENPEESDTVNRVICAHPDEQEQQTGSYIDDYAPQVFRYIREVICGLSNESYAHTFNTYDGCETLARESYSEGRSGSFFYFTCDSRFIVKTITHREAKFLLKILKNYVMHLTSH